MKIRVQFCLLATLLLVGGSFVVAPPPVTAQDGDIVLDAYDHLRCWTIKVDEHRYYKDLDVETEFDGGRKCKIQLPPERVCVAANKDKHDDYDGDVDWWGHAGYWLCYRILGCDGHVGWDSEDFSDQFDSWKVKRYKNDYFCAPAKKSEPYVE